MAFPPARLTELISEASHNVAKLPAALVSCGVALSSAALSLIFFKAPSGIFLRLHGNTPQYMYYGCLVPVAVFGLAQATFGYWVLPRDQDGWRAIAVTMLWFSIFPLVLVAALGGGAFLK
ncbi:unnamed protein product [Urochloa humidicola]